MGPSQCKTEFSWRATGAIGTALIPCCARPATRCTVPPATPIAARPRSRRRDARRSGCVRLGRLADHARRIRPRHVMHQLTDLALLGDPPAPARPRGTMRASATKARATWSLRRWPPAANAGGPEHRLDICAAGSPPCDEAQALDLDAQGDRRVSVMGVVALERQVLGAPGITGTVLRYGRLYGPGTGATTDPRRTRCMWKAPPGRRCWRCAMAAACSISPRTNRK